MIRTDAYIGLIVDSDAGASRDQGRRCKMADHIEIAPGVTYEPSPATSGRPEGLLYINGDAHYVQPFIAPTMIKGHEFVGSASPMIGAKTYGKKGAGANLSVRVWLLMQAADRRAAGSDEDVAATYASNEAARKKQAAANAKLTSSPRTLTAGQIKERDYDRLHNEGAHGYNPHRGGDRPTYWRHEARRERHYPEGA